MKLKKLILHNYKQHADLEQEFNGHFIGIVGRNGAGKSNLLGALNFALSGEQPGFKKTDLLRWGSSSGYVKLEFEHNGVEGLIYRELNTSRAEFMYGDESYSTATAVSKGIYFHLGLDKDILKQTIFVRQAEIDSILFEDPRVRQLAFQKLCGVGDAAKIHKKLGEELSGLKVPPDYGEQIADGKQRQAEMQERLNQLQTTLDNARTEREKCPSTAVLQSEYGVYTGISTTLNRLNAVLTEISEYNGVLAVAEEQQLELDAHVPGVDVQVIDSKLDKARKDFTARSDYDRLRAAWEQAGKAIIALGDKPVPRELPYDEAYISQLEEAANSAAATLHSLKSEIKMYEDLERTVGQLQNVPCPVCATPMKDASHVKNKLDELRGKLSECDAEQARKAYNDAVEVRLAVQRSNATALQTYQFRYDSLVKEYTKAEADFKAVEAGAPEQAATVLEAEIQALELQRNAVISAFTKRNQLTNTITNAKAQLLKLNQEQEQLVARVEEIPGLAQIWKSGLEATNAHIAQRTGELASQIQELQNLDQQLAQLTGMVGELKTNLEQLESTLKTLEDKRSNQGAYKAVIDTLTNVRNWFHYNNGPNTLANSVLNSMNTDINDFLAQFSAPFSVSQSEEALGFKCLFHDGRDMPDDGAPDAYHLSGGQRIQLAIAFRFASYCMFANKLGLLSLDEPTVHLDEQNVGAFCTLISKVREVAQKMDLQVLISTHEPSVIPFMDTVIRVGD